MLLPRRFRNDSPLRKGWIMGASVGLVTGTLALSTLWQRGYTQSFTEQEISTYAAAVMAIEEIRPQAYADISDLMTIANEDVTRYDLRCLSASGLETLPRTVRSQVRRLLVNYCNDAKEIVEEVGLTAQLFNSITVTHRQDEALTEQIQLEIANLQ